MGSIDYIEAGYLQSCHRPTARGLWIPRFHLLLRPAKHWSSTSRQFLSVLQYRRRELRQRDVVINEGLETRMKWRRSVMDFHPTQWWLCYTLSHLWWAKGGGTFVLCVKMRSWLVGLVMLLSRNVINYYIASERWGVHYTRINQWGHCPILEMSLSI